MKNDFQKLLMITLAVATASCSKQQFSDVSQTAVNQTQVPVDPTPVVSKSFALSNGICNSDSSTNVLSCLKCDVPQVVVKPQLSAKAQALVDSMYLACQISNKSDLSNYRPTKDQIINKLNRGSDLLYPETTRTAQMELVIQGLTNESDNSLRQKMFGGLWYQPPYSDAFETYFGLTVQEAKSTFCWDGNVQTPSITNVTGVYSKQYLDCQYTRTDWWNCKETPAYVAAQGYRSQLQNVLAVSISNPFVAPPVAPAQVCSWDKFSGDDLVAAKVQLHQWQAEGRSVALSVTKGNGVGFCGVANESNLTEGVTVELASYVCK